MVVSSSPVCEYPEETDLLTQEETLGGEYGEAVPWRTLGGAVCRRSLAHLTLLLLETHGIQTLLTPSQNHSFHSEAPEDVLL